MKYIKKYEKFGKFEYGDYIIYQKQKWRNEKSSLIIMSVHSTPGPIGSKWDYYVVNELYELVDGKLNILNETTWEPKQYDQDVLERNTVYHTKTLEDAKNMIFVIADENKYNL